MTPEEYEYYTLLAALRTKANPVTAGMAGLTQPVISAIPFYENALRAWEEWAPQQLGFEPVAGTGVQETFQNAQLQHPAAYSVGRVAGEAAANSTLQGLLSNTPVGTWFNSFGQKASQTAPMQALQQLPGVGHLGTPQSITGILEGTAYDTLTQTGPYAETSWTPTAASRPRALHPANSPSPRAASPWARRKTSGKTWATTSWANQALALWTAGGTGQCKRQWTRPSGAPLPKAPRARR